jgi:hypothetical protein
MIEVELPARLVGQSISVAGPVRSPHGRDDDFVTRDIERPEEKPQSHEPKIDVEVEQLIGRQFHDLPASRSETLTI